MTKIAFGRSLISFPETTLSHVLAEPDAYQAGYIGRLNGENGGLLVECSFKVPREVLILHDSWAQQMVIIGTPMNEGITKQELQALPLRWPVRHRVHTHPVEDGFVADAASFGDLRQYDPNFGCHYVIAGNRVLQYETPCGSTECVKQINDFLLNRVNWERLLREVTDEYSWFDVHEMFVRLTRPQQYALIHDFHRQHPNYSKEIGIQNFVQRLKAGADN